MKRTEQDVEGFGGVSTDLPTSSSTQGVIGRVGLILLAGLMLEIYVLVLRLDLINPTKALLLAWPVALILVCAVCLAAVVHRLRIGAIAVSWLELWPDGWRRIARVSIVVGIVGSLIIVWVLRAFPNSGDEYDYVFQAKTFLAGRMWNPVPPEHEFFAFFWQLFRNGKWTTFYPPGWPLLLAAVQEFRVPAWLACPLAGGVLLFAAFKVGQRRDGIVGAALAAGLVALSPFFLFNAASYFMQVPAAAAGLLFCWAAVDFLDEPFPSRALLAGISLGALGLIRPEDVPMFALPFAIEFLWRARRPHYRLAPLIIGAGLPFLAVLLLYDHAVLGSAIPRITMWRSPSAHFGFLGGVNMFGQQRTPLDEVRFAVTRIVMLMEWTSPLLVLGYVASFRWLLQQRRLSFVDFIFPVFVITYLCIPFWGGNQYGPRYYFEGYPALVLTTVSGLRALLGDGVRPRRPAFGASLVIAHCIMCIVGASFIAVIMRQVIDQRMDIYDQVRAEQLHNSVVVIRSSTGYIEPMLPMDLTRNGITLDGDVIYALDIPERLKYLRRLFPDRQFYVYSRDPHSPKGTLRPLVEKNGLS